MPVWVQILLACLGTLNVVGWVTWVVKSVFELKASVGLLQAAVKNIDEGCTFCTGDKKELFQRMGRLERVNVAIATKMGIDLSAYNIPA